MASPSYRLDSPYGLWLVGLSEMFFLDAIDWIASGVRPVLSAMSLVGVFPLARSRTSLTVRGVQGLPLFAGFFPAIVAFLQKQCACPARALAV